MPALTAPDGRLQNANPTLERSVSPPAFDHVLDQGPIPPKGARCNRSGASGVLALAGLHMSRAWRWLA